MYANSQHFAAATMIKLGMTTVWERIEEELIRRKSNAAWLGRKLRASRQVVSGWKKRGVPAARHEEIAELLGWTLDRLVNGPADEPPAPEPANDPKVIYSPMALDLARRLDEISDEHQRSRAYAIIMQILMLAAAPAPIAKQVQLAPLALAKQPTSKPDPAT